MTWLDQIPGIKDVVDATAAVDVTLPRGHTMVFSGAVVLTPDAVNKKVLVQIGGVAALALSSATPAAVTRSVGVAGVGTEASRADHKHDVATAAAITLTDATNDEGVSTSLARADHTHSHGARAGGTLHADVTPSVAGFMTAADKTKLDTLGTLGAVPVEITDATNTEGVAVTVARTDHAHSHGARAGGTLHADATTSVAGFLDAAGKTKLDGIGALNVLGTTAGVSGSTTAGVTLDFSSMSLAAGDMLVVHLCHGWVNNIAPAGEGWDFHVNDVWPTAVRQHWVYTKIWGVGDTDDTTPTFTLDSNADVSGIGFAIRGVKVSGTDAVATDAVQADFPSGNDPLCGTADIDVAGSLILRFGVVADAVATLPSSVENDSARKLYLYQADNATDDFCLSCHLDTATIGGLPCGPMTMTGSIGVACASATVTFEPATT